MTTDYVTLTERERRKKMVEQQQNEKYFYARINPTYNFALSSGIAHEMPEQALLQACKQTVILRFYILKAQFEIMYLSMLKIEIFCSGFKFRLPSIIYRRMVSMNLPLKWT